MAKQRVRSATVAADERLRRCAERAQETDRLANEAEAQVSRLRKELKRARKAYKEAKDAAKEAARQAQKARAELSECLDGAFQDLAIALHHDEATPDPAPAGQQGESAPITLWHKDANAGVRSTVGPPKPTVAAG